MHTCIIKFRLTCTNYNGLPYLGRNNDISSIRLRNCIKKTKKKKNDRILNSLKRTAQMCNNCVTAVYSSYMRWPLKLLHRLNINKLQVVILGKLGKISWITINFSQRDDPKKCSLP